MVIQVGQVLDKYELLERVGQGGMAVVYRGLDRSLKRTVAVKILHKHLSDYQEARDRFEREAQAVAKLRHENILEIFDYAAREDSEAYIVTEFIDGQTLKQFITDRPITYPEIGAMIMLQVCRALAHAHAGGILHRDVKPENIMIRSDGVVKLMDFGISHMVDLERLTVTGQLLGSPAYMAPEHVEGRPLDFRTDVFAAGIVLYQLTVGKLPFEGKNPHEVLKRIAECKFVDPRQANARIGNRLGKIILRAMAAQPNDRYPAIGEMVLALEAYLEESGLAIDKVPGELARYFQGPVAYEQSLKVRLIDHLTRRGQQLLDDGDQARALDVFDRVLTIDPANAKVLGVLDRINRRTRFKQIGMGIAAAAVIAGGAVLIHLQTRPAEPEAPPEPPLAGAQPGLDNKSVAHVEPPPPAIDAPAATERDDATHAVAIVTTRPDARAEAPADAAPAVTTTKVQVSVVPAKNSEYSLDDGPWLPVGSEKFSVEVTHDSKLRVRNPYCEEAAQTVGASHNDVAFQLTFRPATITALCDQNVQVTIGGKPWNLKQPFPVLFGNTSFVNQTIDVEFLGGAVADKQRIEVTAGQAKEVTCARR